MSVLISRCGNKLPFGVICTCLLSCILSAKLFFVTHNTGQFLAVGTSNGAVGQYLKPSSVSTAAWLQNAENGEGLRTTELYRVNEVSCSCSLKDVVRLLLLATPWVTCTCKCGVGYCAANVNIILGDDLFHTAAWLLTWYLFTAWVKVLKLIQL
jgi:hypothetical protein